MTPQQFIAKWGAPGGIVGPAYALNEEQGAQSHFLDLCELLDVPKPGSVEGYLFEGKSSVIGGKTGYADVSMRGVFAWENKAPGKNLDSALKQLLNYSLALNNPPLLVVSDRLTIRIHTQFTGHPSQTWPVGIEALDQPEKRALLRRIWCAPESFKPAITNRDITETAAKSFATLADGLRRRGSKPSTAAALPVSSSNADCVAHFLTQCLFCFFAEDVGLLPGRMFERLVNNRQLTPARLSQGLGQLFAAMQCGGMFGADDIAWFNGGLFKTIAVPELSILDVTELRRAADLNWSAIDVSIFGTLFERGLDPSKRSQLGAHYTDTATIDRIIEPVMRRPLLQKWELTRQALQGLMAKNTKRDDKHHRAASQLFMTWLDFLKNYRVLDPACGSGNFLFLALKCLKDIELRSHLEAADLGLDRQNDLVTGPHNVLGIELNEYAAELARVTVWIGELQWRLAHGYEFKINPVLEPLEHIECRDALLAMDAQPATQPLVPAGQANTATSGTGAVTEATWPHADVVIGNPPFLGGSKKRRELGDCYFAALDRVFAGRVPGGADLVCYWFDKAHAQIQSGKLVAAGLVATQAIRAGSNRCVLEKLLKFSDLTHNSSHDDHHFRHTSTGGTTALGGDTARAGRSRGARDCQESGQPGDPALPRPQAGEFAGTAANRSGGSEMDDGPGHGRGDVPGAQELLLNPPSLSIFSAWADEPWVNNGAAVRVSLVCFGVGAQTAQLNGVAVNAIHADLTSGDGLDLTQAKALPENLNTSFEGTKKYGDFDIPGSLARQWLSLPNPHGKSNAQVAPERHRSRRRHHLWHSEFPHPRSLVAGSGFHSWRRRRRRSPHLQRQILLRDLPLPRWPDSSRHRPSAHRNAARRYHHSGWHFRAKSACSPRGIGAVSY
ncbi:MAG: DNA methyltransferase [Rhodoferax sp.]